jgi:hypothetical protein
VETSHGITRDLKFQIMEKISNSTVTIHIEPCDGNCTEVCLSGCLLPEDQRKRLSMVDTGRDH